MYLCSVDCSDALTDTVYTFCRQVAPLPRAHHFARDKFVVMEILDTRNCFDLYSYVLLKIPF
jgi:hypothetical protein